MTGRERPGGRPGRKEEVFAMRRRWLVCYDITDARRLRRVHKTVKGYGERLQYSVFSCILSKSELQRLIAALRSIIDESADSVMIVDVGLATAAADSVFRFIGEERNVDPPRRLVI